MSDILGDSIGGNPFLGEPPPALPPQGNVLAETARAVQAMGAYLQSRFAAIELVEEHLEFIIETLQKVTSDYDEKHAAWKKTKQAEAEAQQATDAVTHEELNEFKTELLLSIADLLTQNSKPQTEVAEEDIPEEVPRELQNLDDADARAIMEARQNAIEQDTTERATERAVFVGNKPQAAVLKKPAKPPEGKRTRTGRSGKPRLK